MSTTNIKEQIRKLVDLQKIDGQIFELKKELTEKPLLIKELQQGFETKKGTLHQLEEDLKRVQLDRKAQELELKTQEDNILKANAKLGEIKTNKEYSAKLMEIESIKADKSIIEEKILILYDAADQASAKIDEEKKALSVQEKDFLASKKKIEEEMMILEDRVKVLESQRKQNLDGIAPEHLKLYEKILVRKEGLAIVPIIKSSNSCGGCYMNLTQQMTNQIKAYQELVGCEMCNRLLYIEEDL